MINAISCSFVIFLTIIDDLAFSGDGFTTHGGTLKAEWQTIRNAN